MSTKWTFVHVALYYEKRGFSGARVCGAPSFRAAWLWQIAV